MKILYVIEGGLPYGSNRSLIGLVRYFHDAGLDISVAGKSNGLMKEWIESLDIDYFPVNIEFLIYPRIDSFIRKIFYPIFIAGRIAANILAIIRLTILCNKIKPDIIHTNVGPVSVGYYVSRILSIKHVWHLREFQDLDFGIKFFPSKNAYLARLRKSEYVICVSKAVAEHFYQSPSSVIYNGVAGRYCIPSIEKKDNLFLFVANLQPSKGVEAAMSAYFEFLHHVQDKFHLLIIGNGKTEYVERLKHLAGEQARIGNIQFLGYRDDVSTWMRRAKAVIVASEHEGFGRVAAEAMFNGCLVIGKKVAGTAEILEPWHDSQVALLFADHYSLVERMIEAAAIDEIRYTQIVAAAQRKAIEFFTVEACGKRILDIYNRLAPSSK